MTGNYTVNTTAIETPSVLEKEKIENIVILPVVVVRGVTRSRPSDRGGRKPGYTTTTRGFFRGHLRGTSPQVFYSNNPPLQTPITVGNVEVVYYRCSRRNTLIGDKNSFLVFVQSGNFIALATWTSLNEPDSR